MDKILRTVYIAIGLVIMGYFGYTIYYGKAFWESSKVHKNTQYTRKGYYGGYGNRLNHK